MKNKGCRMVLFFLDLQYSENLSRTGGKIKASVLLTCIGKNEEKYMRVLQGSKVKVSYISLPF